MYLSAVELVVHIFNFFLLKLMTGNITVYSHKHRLIKHCILLFFFTNNKRCDSFRSFNYLMMTIMISLTF